MSAPLELAGQNRYRNRAMSGYKKLLLIISTAVFAAACFLYLTPIGNGIRTNLAEMVIMTKHRSWAWLLVGASTRDKMVDQMHSAFDVAGADPQDLSLIKYKKHRSTDSLIKVEDISGKLWKGKKMYVFDPTTVRVVVPGQKGEGEKITSMVQRTGAIAGINGGGFVDPDGLGNGFAPIGLIMSNYRVFYDDAADIAPQHVVGFTDEGTLIVGKYSMKQLQAMKVKEAVAFYPRLIANGKPLNMQDEAIGGRNPRTAIGQKADGTLIFIVIDGRQANTLGATYQELQDLFMAEGVINAGCLDGGASAEMVVGGNVITSPSSRYGERRLPTGFLIFDNPADVKVDNVWDGVTKIDPGGAYDNPDFQRELAVKKKQAKATPKATPAATPAVKPTATPEPSATADTGANSGTGSSGTAPSDGTTTDGTKPVDSSTPTDGSGTGTGTTIETSKPTVTPAAGTKKP